MKSMCVKTYGSFELAKKLSDAAISKGFYWACNPVDLKEMHFVLTHYGDFHVIYLNIEENKRGYLTFSNEPHIGLLVSPEEWMERLGFSTNIEFPPHEFSNFLNSIGVRVDPYTWRESQEWKIFVAGWNAGCESVKNSIEGAKLK